jgi:hypothetical protein
MDPGEQTTGTRDEHYDLISVLYHALQGADACDAYALDAEASGRRAELVEFLRETQTIYVGVAERAKELLGIAEVPPRLGVPPGVAPEEVERPEDVVVAEEDAVLEEETVTPEAPEAATIRVDPGDFDATISALRGGVANLEIERALAEIDDWQLRLEESGDPELLPVAENLRRLSALLTADEVDAQAVGELLKDLGGQVQHLADSGLVAWPISEKLKTLGGLLASEGDTKSG